MPGGYGPTAAHPIEAVLTAGFLLARRRNDPSGWRAEFEAAFDVGGLSLIGIRSFVGHIDTQDTAIEAVIAVVRERGVDLSAFLANCP